MTIYHFCASRHVKKILREGLTVGMVCVPVHTGYIAYTGYTWLTLDPEPTRQSWATRNAIKYSRTAYRLTITIPASEEHRVMDQAEVEDRFPGSGVLFKGWGGSENWRVFRGSIPKEWIEKAEKTE